jgi:uncharacterized protein with HEPN domain
MSRDDASLRDILHAGRRVMDALQGSSQEALEADWRLESAVLYQLAIIGEAVKRLSGEFRAKHPAIPWQDFAGMRDVLIHRYHEVDLQEVWETVEQDLPKLIAYIESIAPGESSAT